MENSWVARSVTRPILDFGLSDDPRVVRLSPSPAGSALGVEPASDSLFPSPSAPPPCLRLHSLSLSKKKGGYFQDFLNLKNKTKIHSTF